METKTGWLAEWDDDEDTNSRYPWRPRLQVDESWCPTLMVWFATKEECERFIREHIIGQTMLDD